MSSSSSSISASRFIAIVTLANMVLYHLPLYRFAIGSLNMGGLNGKLTFVTLVVIVSIFTALILFVILLIIPILARPFCMLAAVTNACAVYFVSTYSVILDRSMMGNVLNTRAEESGDFLSLSFFVHVLLLGILPAFLISRWRIEPVRRRRLLAHTAVLVTSLVATVYLSSSSWLWFDQHSKKLGGMIMPWSYTFNTIRTLKVGKTKLRDLKLLPAAKLTDNSKMLVVLVIGETARTENFSLYGYERDTNPQLETTNVTVIPGAQACSTYTTASVHCMLSYDGKRSGSDEVLPSYLQRHGVNVIWRTNNWGEPPLAVGSYKKATELRKTCNGEQCEFDDALLSRLEQQIRLAGENKTLVVLHTKGSHGPSYYARYPDRFSVFKPVCRSVELDQCDEQSLTNAYDNTILYTDDFLYRAIQTLEKMADIPSVLLYISDHGESLGEFGLYLHGTPYTIAPDVQKDVPFIIWMSDSFRKTRELHLSGIDAPDPLAHSRIFHSVLGAFGLQSPVYDRTLDLFAP